jgi:hypothetical protein
LEHAVLQFRLPSGTEEPGPGIPSESATRRAQASIQAMQPTLGRRLDHEAIQHGGLALHDNSVVVSSAGLVDGVPRLPRGGVVAVQIAAQDRLEPLHVACIGIIGSDPREASSECQTVLQPERTTPSLGL